MSSNTALSCAPRNCQKQIACATLAINHIKQQIAAGKWPPQVNTDVNNKENSPTTPQLSWESITLPDWSGA